MLQNITTSRYAQDIQFEDPITCFNDLQGYVFMVRALRTLFNIKFDLHTMDITGPTELTARYVL